MSTPLHHRVSKLRLQPNDILIVRDLETAEALRTLKVPGVNWTIPIVIAPNGIQKLSKADLLQAAMLMPPERKPTPPLTDYAARFIP